MILPLWRSLYSLNLMLPKEDRKAMLLRLYNEDTPLMDHSKDLFKKTSSPGPLILDSASDSEIEEAAAAEAQEKLAVETGRENSANPHSDDEDNGKSAVALGRSGMTAPPTTLGHGEESKRSLENYGHSTGMDNVLE